MLYIISEAHPLDMTSTMHANIAMMKFLVVRIIDFFILCGVLIKCEHAATTVLREQTVGVEKEQARRLTNLCEICYNSPQLGRVACGAWRVARGAWQ